jgi:hypothetical protein
MSDVNATPPAEKPAGKKPSNPLTVYCKLPHGIRYTLSNGDELRLVGALGDERSPLQTAGMPGRDSIAGFGVTRNVDPSAWEEVVKSHGKSLAHVNGLIFAHESDKSGVSEAKEKKAEPTGFEPMDPSKDPMRDDGKKKAE